jgi:hypothetical protein
LSFDLLIGQVKMAVSPLLPRSPSNINANVTAGKPKSLTVRSSSSSTTGKPSQPKEEFDLAEKMNEEIASKYVKGTSLVSVTIFNRLIQAFFPISS